MTKGQMRHDERAIAVGQKGKCCLTKGQLLHDNTSTARLNEGPCRPAENVAQRLKAERLLRGWGLQDRRSHMEADAARRERNAAAAAASLPLEYVYRSLYLPEQGMFCELPEDLQLSTVLEVRLCKPLCWSCLDLLPAQCRE